MFDKNCLRLVARKEANDVCTKYLSFFEWGKKRVYNTTTVYDKEVMIKTRCAERVCLEIATKNKLRHPNLVNVLDTFQDYSYVYIVYDLYDSVSMEVIMKKHPITDSNTVVTIIAQMFSALFYLSNKKILLAALVPKSIAVDRRSGRVKICLDNYANKDEIEELGRVHGEYFMPCAPGYEPIHPAFYSVGIIMKKLANTDRGPQVPYFRLHFLMVFMANELCDPDRKTRLLFECGNFHRIKNDKLFCNVNWEDVSPVVLGFLEPQQTSIYQYSVGQRLCDVYPVPQHHGNIDGYGSIFKSSESRYITATREPVESHIYNGMP